MARREEAEMIQLRRKWRERILSPDFRALSYKEQGKELGVSDQTISNWRNEITPARWQEILDMTVNHSAEPTLSINDALRAKALSGDVPAIKLWHEIIRGWSSKQINENWNRNSDIENLSDEELKARKLKALMDEVSEEELEKALAEKKAGIVRLDDLKEASGQ
jgi:hypothetical protein